MRPINIIGLCCFFLPLAIKYRSKRALIIFLNGLLYHSNERYQYLRYYDVICNFFIVLYTIKNNAAIVKYPIFGSSIWILNTILTETSTITRNLSDIIHVIGIQLPLARGLELTLNKKLILN